MSTLKYWVWLSSLQSFGADKKAELLAQFFTPEDIFFADDEALLDCAFLAPKHRQEIMEHNLDPAERILEACDRLGIQMLTQQDALYPERLRNIFAPPVLLYYKGKMPVIDEEVALTMVGSRKTTAYGLQVAGRLAYGLARAGALIVSGMARGIDAHAHAAALQAGAATVAVLGCGVDVIYPAENHSLYHDILACGAVVSEYAPGVRALGEHFPVRNRILSGLSLGTIVVEAPEHSGALITARHALDQGRDVFAIPGNIDVKESAGCNRLIQQGAQLVMRPSDVLQEYAVLYPHKITVKNVEPKNMVLYPQMRKDFLQVAETVKVPAVFGSGEPDVDEVPELRVSSPSRSGQKSWRRIVTLRERRNGQSERIKASGQTEAEAGETRQPDAKSKTPVAFDLSAVMVGRSEESQAILVCIAGASKTVDELVRMTNLPTSRVLRELTMLELDGVVCPTKGKRFALHLEDRDH